MQRRPALTNECYTTRATPRVRSRALLPVAFLFRVVFFSRAATRSAVAGVHLYITYIGVDNISTKAAAAVAHLCVQAFNWIFRFHEHGSVYIAGN